MPNRLASATSPYLLQHANNPVDWHEWGPEALNKARAENKPILLSIGYAACHWCHVMERESFEDEATAALMNDHFVPIKVDREERPDLDQIYMDAVQAMTGHGGWPMTVFCTPDGKPFFGGTYYPPEDRHGLPGFKRLLAAVNDAWLEKHDDVLQQAAALTTHLDRTIAKHDVEHELQELTLTGALERLRESFDPEWGGFGQAPKFPQPMLIDFALRAHERGYAGALSMANTTLRRMARGGMFDHIGGGFARYSVDAHWHVPHFEKMLYDNGQLLRLYTRAWLVTHDDLYRDVAIATADWLLREMRHVSGGFFSSLDADSEGEEGKYYVWNFADFARICGDDTAVAASIFDVSAGGNWEGTNVLWSPRDHESVAQSLGISTDEIRAVVERVRPKLLEARASRVRPGTDDKILAAWNGLAISGLAEAGRVFSRRDYVEAADGAATFVLSEMRDGDGRLHRSWREGRTSGPGFLDDYASMAAALLDLYETTFDESRFTEANALAAEAVRLFSDDGGAGFFETGIDADALVIRPREVFDNAVPSGSAVMCDVLQRLAALTGDVALEERAAAYMRMLQPAMASTPHGFGHLLGALDLYLARAKEIAVAASPAEADAFARVVWSRPTPNRVLAVGDPDRTTVPLLQGRTRDGGPAAYVCERFVCKRPVSTPDELNVLLGGGSWPG